MRINCKFCSKEIVRPLAHIVRVRSHYCSKPCRWADKRYVVKTCTVCGADYKKHPSMASRFRTCGEDSCRKMSKVGKANPNWRGGVTKNRKLLMSRKDYKLWRLAVFVRDDYTCQFCGQRGRTLNADHIKPWTFFPELRYEVSNGRTLCLACHKTTYKDSVKHRSALVPTK